MALWYALEHHGGALEFDLHRYCGLDLADMYRGTITTRKVAVLLEYLPPDSAVRRRVGGEGSLTIQEHALRNLFHAAQLQLYQGGGGKGSKPKEPQIPPTYEHQRQVDERNQARRDRWLAKYGHTLPSRQNNT